ncbi:MAG: nitrilase family protein [Chloroflexota bacterium]|nr:nitrilase family protein [Chloroflexota bacterium]
MEPHVGAKSANVAQAVEMLRRAIDQQADLIVLPELSNSGYVLDSRSEAFDLAELIPAGPTCEEYLRTIRSTSVYVVAGVCEREGNRLYNTAVLLGPDGYIGKYRKIHLWDEERLFFEPGDHGLPVFHLPFGRVGALICYDAWFPETIRILKLQGADIICDPTCWVLLPGVNDAAAALAPQVHMVQAHMNNLFIVCADRCGVERGCAFIGSSCITGPNGFVAGPASDAAPQFLMADINLTDARYNHRSALSDLYGDRRIDVYDVDLGYHPLEHLSVRERRTHRTKSTRRLTRRPGGSLE